MTSESSDPWGVHASTYDRVFAPLTGYIARSVLAMTQTRTPPGSRMIDIACGSGALLVPALERAMHRRGAGHPDFVVGCDFSAGMVAETERKARMFGAPDAYRCDVQNGQALREPDASFDAAFSCFGIFLFEDRIAGWNEAARVLKPGGVFATTTWMAPEHNEMFRAQFGPLADALPSRMTENATPPGWLLVAEPARLESEVASAGFTDVETTAFRTAFVLPSADIAWNAMLDNPAAGELLRQCSDDEVAAVREAFDASMQQYAPSAGRPIVLEAACNVLVARRA